MDGIICINKPEGWTSFDVVAKSRGIAKTRKVGHAGTLDPMATGVLPLYFGAATKLCDMMPDAKKGYLATFHFGVTTDTLDRTGVVQSVSDKAVSKETLERALADFRGDILQIPPMYSAIQIDGKRLYELARAGKEVERKARPVTIHALTLLHYDEHRRMGQLQVRCSKGTYIRSLIDDLGKAVGAGATLWELERDFVEPFTLSDCVTLQELQQLSADGKLETVLKPLSMVFDHLPTVTLDERLTRLFCNGVKLSINQLALPITEETQLRVVDEAQRFLGLARVDQETQRLCLVKAFWQTGGGKE